MKRLQLILSFLALLFFFFVFVAIENRVTHAQAPPPMVFSVGVTAKINVTNMLKVPRCSSSAVDCVEYTKLCDSKGACVLWNAGAFTIHGGTQNANGGATNDVPYGDLKLTLGKP